MRSSPIAVAKLKSPFGDLIATADSYGRVVSLGFAGEREVGPSSGDAHWLTPLRHALQRYYAGRKNAFDRLELNPEGTSFQHRVWSELRHVPFGTTLTYGELAQRIRRASAARAVGMANNANPIAIVIPCHRVVGANGDMTGYAGGISNKRLLLDHESGQAKLFKGKAKGKPNPKPQG